MAIPWHFIWVLGASIAPRLLAAAGGERERENSWLRFFGLCFDCLFVCFLFNNPISLPCFGLSLSVLLQAAWEVFVCPTMGAAACRRKPSMGTEVTCHSPCQKVTVLGEMP